MPGRRVANWVDFPVRRESSEESVLAVDNVVAPGYFETLRVPIRRGP